LKIFLRESDLDFFVKMFGGFDLKLDLEFNLKLDLIWDS